MNKKNCFHSVFTVKRVFQRSFHGGIYTVKIKNLSQPLQVWTVQVLYGFATMF